MSKQGKMRSHAKRFRFQFFLWVFNGLACAQTRCSAHRFPCCDGIFSFFPGKIYVCKFIAAAVNDRRGHSAGNNLSLHDFLPVFRFRCYSCGSIVEKAHHLEARKLAKKISREKLLTMDYSWNTFKNQS